MYTLEILLWKYTGRLSYRLSFENHDDHCIFPSGVAETNFFETSICAEAEMEYLLCYSKKLICERTTINRPRRAKESERSLGIQFSRNVLHVHLGGGQTDTVYSLLLKLSAHLHFHNNKPGTPEISARHSTRRLSGPSLNSCPMSVLWVRSRETVLLLRGRRRLCRCDLLQIVTSRL